MKSHVNRWFAVALVGIGWVTTVVASPDEKTARQTDGADCYSKVGPVLQSAEGKLTPEVRRAYLDWAEKRVISALSQGQGSVSPDLLSAVDKDASLRDAIFGSVFPPDPSILQNYAELKLELGEPLFTKYRSLAIAIAVARRVKGVETNGTGKDFGRDYQPDFWQDEALRHPNAEEAVFVRKLADFMDDSRISASELYNDAGLQQRLRTYLVSHGIRADWAANCKTDPDFGEWLKCAMVMLGQRPGNREPKPSTVDWLKHLIENQESTPNSVPTVDGKTLSWPLFPLDNAPWPLLMPLAHPVPISEAKYVWEAFQGQHGPDTYHTYGPYKEDKYLLPAELNPSKWFWDAWPDRIIHGGECVPISKGTVDMYSSLGKPAMWAGQPGHANLISFQFVDGAWTAEVEQAFAGGPDVTFAQWYFDESPRSQIRFRDLYYWGGAEYQLGLAVAMNLGLDSYMDTRIAANIFRAMPDSQKPTLGAALLRDALKRNPYNPEIWYRLAEQTSEPMKCLTLSKAALSGDLTALVGQPREKPKTALVAYDQYWQTLGEFVTQYAILPHPTPKSEADMRQIESFLNTVPGLSSRDQADYFERFAGAASDAPNPEALQYDEELASQGDAFGELRMGVRYAGGEGVARNAEKSREFLEKACRQGDKAAGVEWDELTPVIPESLITVTASSVFGDDQLPKHLVDGSGMLGSVHDNEGGARTMWHTTENPAITKPTNDLPASPAWVRFDFAQPIKFDKVLIWNHNQTGLTNRGLRNVRISGTSDGVSWFPLTFTPVVELPQADGSARGGYYPVPVATAGSPIKSVVISAETQGGNYGGNVYGLSAVHFAWRSTGRTIPGGVIKISASSQFGDDQSVKHLIDDAGMQAGFHDNDRDAKTMWHTQENPHMSAPADGLDPSPAWVRFDFPRPEQFDSILIWNHNQDGLTNRGFRRTRFYGTTDGVHWFSLTSEKAVELPAANGTPLSEAYSVPNIASSHFIKAVIIAADSTQGNYGGNAYGLSGVKFKIH
jgi:TPR repeat protein